MRYIEYCDLDILENDKIMMLRIYRQSFVGKYIIRDFNDQILVGTTSHDFIFSKVPSIFWYRCIDVITVTNFSNCNLYELSVKKI